MTGELMRNKIQLLLVSLTIIIISFPPLCFSEVKTFVKEYTYQASEDDSRNSSRVTAMREVKRLLLEELGTYLEIVTEVKNFQLTKDQITALTAGIVKTEIVSEKWDGHTYWIKTKIVADEGEVIKSIDNLRKDREKSRELLDIQKRADAILEENKKLRNELKLAKGEEKEKQKENYDKSIKELSAIEWLESGSRNADKGDFNTALHDFNTAIELDPKYATPYVARGIAYGSLGKYGEAVIDFSKAIELKPTLALAYFGRGAAYGSLGKHIEAIIDLSKAIELKPTLALAADTYYYRGLAYYSLGKYNEAIIDFSKAAERNPKLTNAYLGRAAIFSEHGKYNKAIIDLSKAIELNPKYAIAYYVRAVAYSHLGNRKRAIQDLSKAIKINPALRNQAKTEPLFDKIRNTPEFIRLMSK